MDTSKLAHYWKTIVVVLGAVTVIGTQVVDTIITNSADGSFSTSDWITVAVLIATSVGVYFKKNKPLPGEQVAVPLDPADDYPKTTDAGW